MTNDRPRVLFVTKYRPDGPPSGALLRTRALISALQTRFDVRVLAYREREAPRPRGKYPSLASALLTRRPYQVARWDTPRLRRAVAAQVRDWRPDAMHVEFSQLGMIGLDFDGPRLLDMHNVESYFAREVASHARGPARLVAARDARLLEKLERRFSDAYELVIVSSRSEADRAPGPVEVVPNGVSVDWDPAPYDEAEPNHAVFVGLFSWLPNIEGAEWLVEEVVPRLPDDVTIDLVGRNPDRRVTALQSDTITVTGEVPEILPYLSRASVVLAPLLGRGGTRFKILEGLMAARPVVATQEAADGLDDLEGEGLTITTTAEEFARETAALLKDPGRAAELGRMGRRAVVDRYGWDGIGRRLLDLYRERFDLE
jgi:glycosyltransferase involved in cell wall biosynthesis